jgi:hypothetical protein
MILTENKSAEPATGIAALFDTKENINGCFTGKTS